ncbi:hypothetical protein TSUD_66390 [Trifolium subterraneum]|uniref:Uncharacterized protein n=1 Tax=Trifolium subterraneum TaxID=3900 RepID=A0A2Z6NRD8_TRISU|nr:hypothetical protein TSUD_66390 [Trifolium subterraneum]
MSQEHEQEQKHVKISNRNRLKAYIQGKGRFKVTCLHSDVPAVAHIFTRLDEELAARVSI